MTDHSRTGLIHHGYQPPAGFGAPQPGVHKASTVFFADTAALQARSWQGKRGYTYGLHGTPTSFTLEERIAHLEGGRHVLLAPSGLAAISLVMLAMLRHGDEVLLPDNVYGPTVELARGLLEGMGIVHRLYDPLDAEALARLITPRTRLLWLEAPGSVTMEFPDLDGLVAAARSAGVPCALDNTWGAGIAFNGFDAGADIVVQALTKYPSGGGDVLMGSVTTRDESLHLKLKAAHMRLGLGVSGNDIELVLRSLPSLALRYQAQDEVARDLATWLRDQPAIAQVLHPALQGSPGHEHWRQRCKGAAGLFSFRPRDSVARAQVHAFVDALRLFRIGYSWAGPISLVMPYELADMRQGQVGSLVRLSVGLEAVEDLRADLAQALPLLSTG